jgi:hypothetical protein
MAKQIQYLRSKAEAIITGIQSMDNRARADNVPGHLADDYNLLISELKSWFAEGRDLLPKPTELFDTEGGQYYGYMKHNGMLIACQQVISLIDTYLEGTSADS